jgi:hypothetical protein
MSDKQLLKQTMLQLEADQLAYTQQAYEEYLSDSAPDLSEVRDHGGFSQKFGAAEVAQAFECPLHTYEEAIAAIEAIDFGPKNEVEAGAVLRVDDRWYVVGVATKAFKCQGNDFIGISTQAPIFTCLEGKQAGDSCEWAGREIRLDSVS